MQALSNQGERGFGAGIRRRQNCPAFAAGASECNPLFVVKRAVVKRTV